jgi:hypothetical protein
MIAGAVPENVLDTLGEDGLVPRERCLLPELQIAVEGPVLVSGLFQLARLFGCFRHPLYSSRSAG